MAELNLSKYGITGTTEVVHNPSYDLLFEEETKSTNEGYEKGQVSELGAVNVMTGIYTGRSPKDKYIVMDENSKDTVWWTSEGYKNDNHPMTESTWASVKDLAIKELSNKKLYVVDAFCGANKDTRMAVRFIVEVAWQAHFVKNMFIQPSEEELKNFTPDFVVYNASKAKVENYKDKHIKATGCRSCQPIAVIPYCCGSWRIQNDPAAFQSNWWCSSAFLLHNQRNRPYRKTDCSCPSLSCGDAAGEFPAPCQRPPAR